MEQFLRAASNHQGVMYLCYACCFNGLGKWLKNRRDLWFCSWNGIYSLFDRCTPARCGRGDPEP